MQHSASELFSQMSHAMQKDDAKTFSPTMDQVEGIIDLAVLSFGSK